MSMTEILASLRANDRERFLFEAGKLDPARLEQANSERYANWFSGIDATLLQITSFVRPEFASIVIDRGASIDLHSACALGNVKVVQEALEANPRRVNSAVSEYFPIQFALPSADSVRLLLAHGDDPNRRVNRVGWFEWEDAAAEQGLASWTPLHMLALGRGSSPHVDVAEVLRENGAIIDATSSPFGEAPIHLSAIYDRANLLRWFVGAGCDVDVPTRESCDGAEEATLYDGALCEPCRLTEGKTPLMLALGEGQESAAKTLLALGARVDARDSSGFTPLHYAAGAFWGEILWK